MKTFCCCYPLLLDFTPPFIFCLYLLVSFVTSSFPLIDVLFNPTHCLVATLSPTPSVVYLYYLNIFFLASVALDHGDE